MSIEVKAEVLPREPGRLGLTPIQARDIQASADYLNGIDGGTPLGDIALELEVAQSVLRRADPDDGSRRIRVTIEMDDAEFLNTRRGAPHVWLSGDLKVEMNRLFPGSYEGWMPGLLEAFRARQLEESEPSPEYPESRRERAVRNLSSLRRQNGFWPLGGGHGPYDEYFFSAKTGASRGVSKTGFHPLDWFADMGGEADEL